MMATQLCSCVGGGVMVGKREEMGGFAVNETRSKPLRRATEASANQNPSKQQLSKSWGNPDQQRNEGGEEIWEYRSGLAWRGAVPMIGIGLPLVVPVGKNGYDFHFPEGSSKADRLVIRSNEMKGAYFGLGSFGEGKGFGFNRLGSD
ncbi:MAG: hypothetical protein AAGI48_08470 [Verrucomicrobiota bacterium]